MIAMLFEAVVKVDGKTVFRANGNKRIDEILTELDDVVKRKHIGSERHG